jgi:hypothetical protein
METAGLGGFAMAAAPAITRFVGGTVADARRYSDEMGLITLARNPQRSLPPLDFAGAPTAIDARRVVEMGIAPLINTGVAHRQAGVGQIGAGIVRDRGYECRVLDDCVASYFPDLHNAALEMVSAQGGIFGRVSDSATLIEALAAAPARR